MTPKQKRFVEEYLIDLNAAAAYRRAGYKAKNDHVAAVNSSALMANHDIQVAIQEAMRLRSERIKLSADDVLEELAILGRSDVWNYQIDDRGNVIIPEGVPKSVIRAVASIKRKVRHFGDGQVEYETEIKLWDKNSALDKAGKHLKLFPDRTEHTGKDGGPIEAKMKIVEELVDGGPEQDDSAPPRPDGVPPQ